MNGFRLILANLISTSRFIFTISIVLLFNYDTLLARYLLMFSALGIFISDVIDGTVSRKLGTISPKIEGMVLDIAADNFVIVTMPICFYWKGMFPLWLVFIVIWIRLLMMAVRLLSAVRHEPFAGPRMSTKAKGWVYGFGLLIFIFMYLLEGIVDIPNQSQIIQFTTIIIALLSVIAAIDFFYTNRRIIFSLYTGS